MAKDIRVRYAPSPTGLLHIGNARTALFNYLMHVTMVEPFIIRIEDTDRKRHVEDGERSQLENLRWLGMDWDESPETHENYRQSERLDFVSKIHRPTARRKEKPTNLTSQKKSWQLNANAKKQLVKHLATSTNTLA